MTNCVAIVRAPIDSIPSPVVLRLIDLGADAPMRSVDASLVRDAADIRRLMPDTRTAWTVPGASGLSLRAIQDLFAHASMFGLRFILGHRADETPAHADRLLREKLDHIDRSLWIAAAHVDAHKAEISGRALRYAKMGHKGMPPAAFSEGLVVVKPISGASQTAIA